MYLLDTAVFDELDINNNDEIRTTARALKLDSVQEKANSRKLTTNQLISIYIYIFQYLLSYLLQSSGPLRTCSSIGSSLAIKLCWGVRR
jgi:hypothetical protein